MVKKEFGNSFSNILKSAAAYKGKAPSKIANHILTFFKANYNKEGYNDNGFTPWKNRKIQVDRKLLVKTGKLRDSIRIRKMSWGSIVVGTDVEYAEYHNEGTANLPKRPIIYLSDTLEKEIKDMISKDFKNMFKF
jgi:phage gpG-like protein